MAKKAASGGIFSVIIALILGAIYTFVPEARDLVDALTGKQPATQSGQPPSVSHPSGKYPQPSGIAGSFGTAKTWLYEKVFYDQPTFYCGCRYSPQDRTVDLKSCGYEARQNKRRASRIEAEHVVPAYWIGLGRSCWRDGHAECVDDGKPFKGRSCCEKVDHSFELAHNDLVNLRPVIGEVNGDRSNYRYAMLEGEPRAYGNCDFEVDFKQRRAEPAPNIRGDIARISFYMEAVHGVNLSDQQRQLFEAWNRQDPVDDTERLINQRIAKIQGGGNPFVK